MLKRLLSNDEIAEVLGVQPPTVRAWRQYLDPPHVKLGKLVKYEEGPMLNWIRAGGPNGLAEAMRAAAEKRRLERETPERSLIPRRHRTRSPAAKREPRHAVAR